MELIVVIYIIGVFLALLLRAVQKVRAAAGRAKCQNNLMQIGLGLHQHNDNSRSLPPALLTGKVQYQFLSWHAHILPWLEQPALWQQTQSNFQQDPHFWSPPHLSTRKTVVPTFVCPADGRTVSGALPGSQPAAFTHYLGVSGERTGDGVLVPDKRIRLDDIRDGASQTLMVGERPPSSNGRYGWWYAGVGQSFDGSADMHMSVRETNRSVYAKNCPLGPYHYQIGQPNSICDTFHYWSLHASGANFLFADGSVRFLSYSADPIMPALATPAGGEVVTVPD